MSANNTPVSDLLGISIEKIKEMADVNAIIGEPIKLPDGTTIIPVCKVSYGFASGGSDLPSKYDKDLFGGGAGAGVSIKPEGFLVISPDGSAKMVSMEGSNDPISNAIEKAPAIIEKISGFINKKKNGGSDTADTVISDDSVSIN
ncbi:GerW family sporulation protein [Ruminococcus flavefaciens]|uniref:GerW family sporulation protein n=1 Tax=Ruminococcus flavefaciens TaxID=1265 RepID=UPI0026EAC7BA|nr:spore germination protein GerW family protein [Ruminococcus flavefaciens]MDD7516122.1 spore germination protein GerW family protein [Ruminococcus flavefaciens]MDY5692205.1 spore germination protein GerW family protein [Ruminococcus flavefaciens]